MIEIRIHGRGGQGAVIASKIIADSFFIEGYEVQSFPAFGVERRGAPVCSYARIDKEPIRLRSEIYSPDHVIVLDINLIKTVDVTGGLKEEGSILINALPDQVDPQSINAPSIACIDATTIAVGVPGENIGKTSDAGIVNLLSGSRNRLFTDTTKKVLIQQGKY